MSRGYRIRMRAPVTARQGSAKASDGMRLDIDLLPILGAAEMQALLSEALAEAGWAPREGALETTIDGARIRLEGDHLSITAEDSQTVTGRGRTASEAESTMRARKAAAESALSTRLGKKVARVEAALCELLEPTVQGVYVEALKRKAAQMGEITSIDERRDGAQVELTIKVKV